MESLTQDQLREQVAELEAKLEKAEKRLKDAKARAQETMREIWQIDVKLEQEEERARAAEARVQELLAAQEDAPENEAAGAEPPENEALQEELETLKAQLAELESQAPDPGLQELLQSQTEEIEKLKEELAAALTEPAPAESGEDLTQELQELRDELDRLREELEQARKGQDDAEVLGEELLKLREELAAAKDRQAELEEQAQELQSLKERAEEGDTASEADQIELHEAQERARIAEEKLESLQTSAGKFEEQLAEIQAKVREAEERAIDWEEKFHRSQEQVKEAESRGDGNGNTGVLEQKIEQLKERLDLAQDRGDLLNQKAQQMEERAVTAENELKDVKNRVTRAEVLAREAEEKLANFRRQSVDANQSASGAEDRAHELEGKLKEAWQKVRDAELKSNQLDVQLSKMSKKLKEYEQRASESNRETQRLAFQDGLTGLPNLNLIRQYLEFTVKQVARYGRASALLVVDLDRFKLINDAMGFKAGDELLLRVSERLQAAIRESDALGRRGEDEFLLLLSELYTGDPNLPAPQKAETIRKNIAIVVDRVKEGLARPFTIQGQKFYIRASIGVSVCPNDAETAQQMLEHADSAMYHAKESGRGTCVFYNADLHRRQERRLAMDSQLRIAMEKNEFEVLYQPIVEVTKGKATMVGVEALLRWNHRVEGTLKPDLFLPAAEESGLIVQLGQWVCQQACWQLSQWIQMGLRIFVSINVSTRQMLQADLSDTILQSVKHFQLPPELLFVELRESGNADQVDLLDRVVNQLGAEGIRIAIDDFGSGYSSLSRFNLKHTKLLKIDQRLVAGVPKDKQPTHICSAAISLAHHLGLRASAEGVENAAQAKFLAKQGCQFMQGYHFQEPCRPDVIALIARERRTWKI